MVKADTDTHAVLFYGHAAQGRGGKAVGGIGQSPAQTLEVGRADMDAVVQAQVDCADHLHMGLCLCPQALRFADPVPARRSPRVWARPPHRRSGQSKTADRAGPIIAERLHQRRHALRVHSQGFRVAVAFALIPQDPRHFAAISPHPLQSRPIQRPAAFLAAGPGPNAPYRAAMRGRDEADRYLGACQTLFGECQSQPCAFGAAAVARRVFVPAPCRRLLR